MELFFNCCEPRKIKWNSLNISEVATDIGFTNRFLTKGGKPWIPVAGEFHFSRFPHEQWEIEILKMKACGINIITTYVFWVHHEETEGNFNFEGDRNLKKFLSICHKHNMLVLLRIGPWCHGEAINGGFPDFIERRRDKRTNSPAYLEKVRNIFKQFYAQSKDYFYQNNSVVIGIQLENEFMGRDKDHIQVLRKLAVETGFILPVYTQTAWPINCEAYDNILPTYGTYPERPWDKSTKPLKTDNRFRIIPSRVDEKVGNDFLEPSKYGETTYDDLPFVHCELGCGVQDTFHRRPIISTEEVYALMMVHLARGMNMPGYYMFHGGRNPDTGLNEHTCPIISYDFQAPISEYGYLRESYYRLKLVHYFLNCYGEFFATQQSFFAEKTGNELDIKVAVRTDGEDRGFVFINNYQRNDPFMDIKNTVIKVKTKQGVRNLKLPDIKSGITMFYPFNISYGDVDFEYITAQPICEVKKNDKTLVYFLSPAEVECRLKTLNNINVNGMSCGDNEYTISDFSTEEPVITVNNTEIYILTQNQARNLWYCNENVVFTQTVLLPYKDKNIFINEHRNCSIPIKLNENPVTVQKFDPPKRFMMKKAQYEFTVPQDIFNNWYDVKIQCNFKGDIAQIYCGSELVADYINIDGTLIIGLRRFKFLIENGNTFTIKVNSFGKFRKLYVEGDVLDNKAKLTIENVSAIEITEQHIRKV